MRFQANRSYDAALDVRDIRPLSSQIQQQQPEGALWLLVAPRRGRKTWTLKALERNLRGNRAKFIDLRSGALPQTTPKKGYYFLLDEPSLLLGEADSGRKFIADCVSLQMQEARVVLALTPAECELLLGYGHASGQVSDKAVVPIRPLTEAEGKTLAGRTTQALTLFEALPASWRRNPFLLELLFELQQENSTLDLHALLRGLLIRCESSGTDYFRDVFQRGLSHTQRAILRRIARGAAVDKKEPGLLTAAALVEWDADRLRHRIADPVLSSYFSTLRIHHVSDVHVGPKSAESIDAKEPGSPLAIAADSGKVRDGYVQHLQKLRAQDLAPHIVVVSGDLTEYATAAQLAEARAWLERVAGLLADDPQLDPSDPRVLIVGGNHDVDWSQTRGRGPAARHRPFAEAFADYRHPHLEMPPAARPVATVAYRDFGAEFLLLGSAELGGEIDEDPERGRLQRELAALAAPSTPAERAAAAETALKAARIDPGLVHEKALERATAHSWREAVRIAVLHHPVAPLPSGPEIARYSGLLNAGAVKDLLFSHGFCLVLHGHTHSGWFCVEHWPGLHEERKLRIASAPSLSSKEVSENHGFNAIDLLRDYDDDGNRRYAISVRRFIHKGPHNWELAAELPSFSPGH